MAERGTEMIGERGEPYLRAADREGREHMDNERRRDRLTGRRRFTRGTHRLPVRSRVSINSAADTSRLSIGFLKGGFLMGGFFTAAARGSKRTFRVGLA